MINITYKPEGEELVIKLAGKIDSSNAAEAEKEINEILAKETFSVIILDAEELQYISSAGLRIILRLRKHYADLKIVNVVSEVYEIFDMTGFTEMMKIEKAYRRFSVEGCEIIGKGANGIVYRINPDTIIKVYKDPDCLPEIQNERELARKAFIMGIPTAIPYDVVKVGETYGSVFEMLNARSFSQIIGADRSKIDECVDLYVQLLKKIHAAELKKGELPDQRKNGISWIEYLQGEIDDALYKKAKAMLEAIPEDYHMIHGDYHTKNVMLQNGETLLIDMDTLCMGHPVYEFAAMYLAYIGFDEETQWNTKDFLGYDRDAAEEIWKKTLVRYFGTEDEEKLQELQNKFAVIGYIRLLRRTLRKKNSTPEKYENRIARCKRHLNELIPKVDSLVF